MESQRIGYGAIAHFIPSVQKIIHYKKAGSRLTIVLFKIFARIPFVIEYLPLEIQVMKSFNLVVWLNCYQIVLRATYFIYPCCFLDAK